MLIFELDNNRAVELSKLDTTKGLPCFNTSGVSPDPKPHRCLSLKLSVRKCQILKMHTTDGEEDAFAQIMMRELYVY